MGYGTRDGNIKTFWPDDTGTSFYIAASETLDEIIIKCREKWGDGVDFTKIRVSPEQIHTDCLTYGTYDPGDWTDFLLVELEQ